MSVHIDIEIVLDLLVALLLSSLPFVRHPHLTVRLKGTIGDVLKAYLQRLKLVHASTSKHFPGSASTHSNKLFLYSYGL